LAALLWTVPCSAVPCSAVLCSAVTGISTGFRFPLTQVEDPDSTPEDTTESKIGPVPKIDLGDATLNADFDRFHEYLDQREFSRALSIIKRLNGKLRKSAAPIAEGLQRCTKEAEAGVVLEKAQKYFDRKKYKQALSIIVKEDADGTAFEGSLIGEELAELRQLAFDEVYLLLEDFEKSKPDAEDPQQEDEDANPRGDRGGQAAAKTKIIGGTPEDGDVRSGKFAMHWQTGSETSWVNLGDAVFKKMIDEGLSLTDYRYLNISMRCENPKARPQLLILFDADGGQVRAPRGGGRRGGGRAFQRDGYNSALIPQGRWQDLRLDLKKFTRKGDVEWDMIEALRLVYTGGPDSLIMIDDVRLEKP
ncbi:MAG: hypothetical protein OSB09_08470, partial [Planctomycetota bacterium]|nr:hypothetical protein [Planctomycetota bacterium]